MDKNAIDQDNTRNAWINEGALIGAVLRDGSIYERASEIVSSGEFMFTCYGWAWDAFATLFWTAPAH